MSWKWIFKVRFLQFIEKVKMPGCSLIVGYLCPRVDHISCCVCTRWCSLHSRRLKLSMLASRQLETKGLRDRLYPNKVLKMDYGILYIPTSQRVSTRSWLWDRLYPYVHPGADSGKQQLKSQLPLNLFPPRVQTSSDQIWSFCLLVGKNCSQTFDMKAMIRWQEGDFTKSLLKIKSSSIFFPNFKGSVCAYLH